MALRELADQVDVAACEARGWALWKALITVTDADSPQYRTQANALPQLLGERVRV